MTTEDKTDALENLLARIRKSAIERAAQGAEAKGKEARGSAGDAGATEEPNASGSTEANAETDPASPAPPPPPRDSRRGEEGFEEIGLDDADVQFEDMRLAAQRGVLEASRQLENNAPGEASAVDDPVTTEAPPRAGNDVPAPIASLIPPDDGEVPELSGVMVVSVRPPAPSTDGEVPSASPSDRLSLPSENPARDGDRGGPAAEGRDADGEASAVEDLASEVAAPPASMRQPRDDLRALEDGERLVDADAFVELVDEDPPPASGEVTSQRLSTSFEDGQVEDPQRISQAEFDVRLAAEESPAAADIPERLGPASPVKIEITADAARYRPMSHNPGVFVGAVRRPAPQSFGALLDATLSLGL